MSKKIRMLAALILSILFASGLCAMSVFAETQGEDLTFAEKVENFESDYAAADEDIVFVSDALEKLINEYESMEEAVKAENAASFGVLKPYIKQYLQALVANFESAVQAKKDSIKVSEVMAVRNVGVSASAKIDAYGGYLGESDTDAILNAYTQADGIAQQNLLYYFRGFNLESAERRAEGVVFSQSGKNEGEIRLNYDKPLKLDEDNDIEIDLGILEYCYMGYHNEDGTGRTNNISITLTDVKDGAKGSGNSITVMLWSLQNDTRVCIFATKLVDDTVKTVSHTGDLIDLDPNESVYQKSLGFTLENLKQEGLQLQISNVTMLDYYEFIINDLISVPVMSLIPSNLFAGKDIYISFESYADDTLLPANNGYINTLAVERINDVTFRSEQTVEPGGDDGQIPDGDAEQPETGCGAAAYGASATAALCALLAACALARKGEKTSR